MIDLLKKVLPDTVEVEGETFKLQTDFQYWLRFGLMLRNKELKFVDDANFLYKGKLIHSYPNPLTFIPGELPSDKEKGIQALIDFYQPKKEIPRATKNQSSQILVDFEIDADIIYASFYEQYRIDLLDPGLHLHWYKFNALFDSLHDTKINEIMSYRAYDATSHYDYNKQMQDLQQAWEIIPPLTEEEQRALDEFDSLLK